tara:strand:- start:825 stop:1310 length:486 start_codon:yes stop_codon:yes gene_type:complete
MVMSFGGLAKAARENYSIIQAGVARGLSSKAINESILNVKGAGIRRSSLLEGMRFAGGVQTAGRNIGNIGFDKRPNYATLPTFNRVSSPKKYLVQYEMRWTDAKTGETGSNFITVATDDTLTRRELDEQAQLAWDEGRRLERYGENREITQLVPMGARQQI